MSNKGKSGPRDGYYDTGRRDSIGRPVYKKTQARATGGNSEPPPSSQSPMDDHRVPTGKGEEGTEASGGATMGVSDADSDQSDDFSGDVTLAQEIEGVLGDHDSVRGVKENDDGTHEVSFKSGARLTVSQSEEDQREGKVELSLETYDDEGEHVEEVVEIQRNDLQKALLMMADRDGDEGGGGALAGAASMLPMMAAEGILGRRMRRGFRRRGRRVGGDNQRGLSAYLVQRFFSMIIPWRQH